MTKHQDYNSEHIKSLTDREMFRHRPTYSMADIGPHGVFHLMKEVFNNSIDEYIQGCGDTINLTVTFLPETKYPRFRIEDFGRGIPLEKFIDSLSKARTSGKYGDKESAYGISGGTYGCGLKLTNALSRDFIAVSRRDGEEWTVKFDEGIQIGDIVKKKYDGKSGTMVEFTPDIQILKDIDISSRKNEYRSFLHISSYISKGITINFKWDKDKLEKFHNPEGIYGYFTEVIKENKYKILGNCNQISYCSEDKSIRYDIIYGFFANGGGSTISYANGVFTKDGGVHVGSLYESMGVLTAALNKGGYLKKLPPDLKITGAEIRDTLFAIVVADKQNARFHGNMKNEFISEDYKPFVIPSMKEQISKWIEKDKDSINKIGEHCALLVKAKYENSKNKEKILKAGASSKSELWKTIDLTKFVNCNTDNPEITELFICEGDSAGSSAKSARDRMTQAIYCLRGKPKNVVKSDEISEELATLITILNIGDPKNKDIKRLRFKKIIVLTDADVDGYHIGALLIAFFNIYYPELIENGNIYVAKPPLYTVRTKGKNLYIQNQSQLINVLSNIANKAFHCIGPDNKKLPHNACVGYMRYLPEYSELVKSFSTSLNIDPILLEAIAIDHTNIINGNLENLKIYGFTGSEYKRNKNGSISFNADKEYQHYFINIDKDFYKNIITPIIKFLYEKVKLKRIRLVGNKSKTIYSPIYYIQGCLIKNLLFNGSFQTTIEKGLGSMDFKDLRETAMDPTTRYIVQLKDSDPKLTSQWIIDLFTNSLAKKEMFSI